MVNTNKLMLYNWVEYLNNPVRVVGILLATVCLDYGGDYGDFIDDVEEENIFGIPITEEILEKCGFYKCENLPDNWFVNDFDDKIFQLRGDKSDEYELIGMATSFKYLHELQNLYFLYRKEPLNIEL